MDRAAIDVDSLLKILLLLVIVWVGLEVAESVFGLLGSLLGPLRPLLGIVLIILILLYLTDRL